MRKSLATGICTTMLAATAFATPNVAHAGVVGEFISAQCDARLENLTIPASLVGLTWVSVPSISTAASLQGLDALVIRYCGTQVVPFTSFASNPAINDAVFAGMDLVLDSDTIVPRSGLPGAPILSYGFGCGSRNYSNAAGSPVASGPGGTLTNDSLDDGGPGGVPGYCSIMGTALVSTLPAGGVPFIVRDATQYAGAFGYMHGAGRVAVSMSQWSNSSIYRPGEYLYPGAKTYFTNALAWAINYVPPRLTTCASEGYLGTKLEWCKNICEKGYSGALLSTWIHRWTERYRDLPYCAL